MGQENESDTFKLTGLSYDDTQNCWWAYFTGTEEMYALIDDVFPVLRPLSSMTEEEAEKYLRLKHNAYSGDYEIKISDAGFWWLFKGISTSQKFKFFGEVLDESNADQFQYLLSKGFDLFDLIPNGLAIEAETQKFKP